MKIGVFSDAHYSSQEISCQKRENRKSLAKVQNAYDRFREEGCEFVVCLGDLIDTEDTAEKEIENLQKIADVMQKSAIPTVCLMGNHDAFVMTPERFYQVLGIEAPRDFSLGGKNFLFLDACYFKNGQHYAPGDSDWRDTFYPFAEELREKLTRLAEPTYVFLHQNVDPSVPQSHRLFNWQEVFSLINQSGVVKAVFQGHYHSGCVSEYDGVSYITLAAMCENDLGFEIFEL